MKKKILILIILAFTKVLATKKPSDSFLDNNTKRLKLNDKLENLIEHSNNLLETLKKEKPIKLIQKYIIGRKHCINFLINDMFQYDDQIWIYQAIKKNNYKKAAELIDDNIDSKGYTPLIRTIRNKDIEGIKFFLKLGVNINKQDKNQKVMPNGTNKYSILTNSTPLMHAIKLNYLDIVKLLVNSGANLNIQDSLKGTALIWAVKTNNLPAVRLLLNSNSDIDLEALTILTPWPEGYTNTQEVDLESLCSAIHFSVTNRYFPITKELIKSGVNVNSPEKNGAKAIRMSEDDDAIELLQANAEITNVDGSGSSALDWTLESSPEGDIRVLLFTIAEKIANETLTFEEFKNLDTIKGRVKIFNSIEDIYHRECLKEFENVNLKVKPILSKRLASEFMQNDYLSQYQKELLVQLTIKEKEEVLEYILDKNYKRIILNLKRIIQLKNLLLGEKYNIDIINKLNGLMDKENIKKLITQYRYQAKHIQELIRKRSFLSYVLSSSRKSMPIDHNSACHISSYLSLKDLKNIK